MFKKIISIVLTMLLLLSCSSAALAWTGLSDANDTNIVRIGVVSDTHQGFTGLQTAINSYYALDSSLDGFIFAGDIIYMTSSIDISLYDELLATTVGPEEKTIATMLENNEIAFAIGNHETPLNSDAAAMVTCKEGFTEKTGQTPNSVKTFGGYRVISVSPNDYLGNYSDDTVNYLKTQVDDALANTTGPVFINLHFGFYDTVVNTEPYGFNCAKFSDEGLAIVEEIKKNPRVIVVSGHTHESNYDPRTIYQQEGGFTAVENSVIAGGTQTFSQGLLLEINKTTNVVTIRRLDFKSGTYIGEPWVVNPDGTNQLYTDAVREAAAGAPAFPQGATVTAVPYETTAMLTVTAATKFAASETDFAYSYKVTYTNEVTGVSQVNTYSSDFYNATPADSLEFKLDGLESGTEYSVSVVAVSPYGIESATPVSTTFETNAVEFESITLEDVVTKDVSARSNTNIASGSIYGTTCGIAGTNWVEFEFDIAASGFYRISTQLGAGSTPIARVLVDGVEKASRTISQGSWNDYKQEMIWADVYLEAGTRTMRFQRTGGSDSIRFYTMSVGKIPDDKIDPVKLGYSVSQTVAEALEYNPSYWKDEYTLTTDTEIDESKTYYTLSDSTYTAVAEPVLDDIATYYEKTRSHGNAHNQNWGSYFVVMKSNDWNTTFKLTPEFSGVYDISLKVGLYSTSTYTVDSVVTVTETRTGLVLKADSSTTTTSDATHTVGTFTKNGIDNDRVYRSYGAVALEAGKEYTIVFDNTSTGDYYALLDAAKITAISFDPSVHNFVTTTYAGESTSDSVTTTNKYGTGAPDSNNGWATTQHYMQFNVFVPADAKYDIYAMGGSDGENNIHYTIQGQSFVAPFANTVLVAGESNSGFNNNRVERLLTKGVNLKKGTYTVYFDVTDSTGGALNFRAFTLKSAGEYSSDNTVLEYSDCDARSTQNATQVAAWFTAANHHVTWQDRYFTAGTYEVWINYGTYQNENTVATLTVDGRQVAQTPLEMNNKYGTTDNSTKTNGTPIDLSTAFKGYIATIRLDEGYHTIKFSNPTVSSTKYYIMDKVKFVPITEPMAELFNDVNVNLDATATEIQDGAMTLRANLPKTDLGKTMNVIFAIYETANTEGALPELYRCEIKEVTIDKNYRAILTIPNISKDDNKTYSYKVFYWDNLNNVKPLY